MSSPFFGSSRSGLEAALTLWLAMAKRLPRPAAEPFGERLRRFRTAKGLTQADLGAKIGLSNRMIAYYEIQGGTPSPDLLGKLAQVLGVSADDLVGVRPRARGPAEGPRSALELRLWRKLRQLQKLPEDQRRAVLKMLDNTLRAHGIRDDQAA